MMHLREIIGPSAGGLRRSPIDLRRCLLVAVALCWLPTQVVDAASARLVVNVVDAASGLPVAARLVLRASDGSYPGDRLDSSAERWPNIEARGVFIRGEETFELPAGPTSLTAARGFEYHAESTEIDLEPDQTHRVQLRLRRAVDMKQAGWVAGDLHVHMIHGENQRATSYEDVALTCAANGLDFVCVGQEYVGAGTLDLQGYQQACRAVSTSDFQMFLGAERPKNILGHMALVGVDNPFLISDEPPYHRAAHSVHARGGVLVYVHPIRYFPGKQYRGQWLDFPGNNLARELVFDSYLGPSFDGLSVLSDEPAHPDAHQLWFNLLNRGCFVPALADSDACFDRPTFGLKAPGFWNTYFHIGPGTAVTSAAIAEAIGRGRTMATTGPLIQFQIDGQLSGATLPRDGKTRTVTIQADYPQHAFSLETVDAKTKRPVGLSRIELIRNGVVVQSWEPHASHALIEHSVSETEPCWYAVRAFGDDDRWQVALASPIYFAEQPMARKREPLSVVVRGRIYDFTTGRPRSGQVEIWRHDVLLKQFAAEDQFQVKMPPDAEIVVRAEGDRELRKNLLMDYGPVHRFLWNLESRDLGQDETFERFEQLLRNVELEFPIGYRMPGNFFVADLQQAMPLVDVRVVSGPERVTDGRVALAALLLDAQRIAPGDTLNVAAVFRDEGQAAEAGPFIIEARGYDPRRPTGFGALKKFASVERTWDTATDLGDGYKLVAGEIAVPPWVEPGPTGAIDLSVRARQGHGDAAHVGFAIPLRTTQRTLSFSNSWPTMPLSWPDRHYGIGPLRICNRLGREGSPKADYRQVQLVIRTSSDTYDLLAERDARGTPDADDAFYTQHFLDQILAEESQLAQRPVSRPQPPFAWRSDLPLIDATKPED